MAVTPDDIDQMQEAILAKNGGDEGDDDLSFLPHSASEGSVATDSAQLDSSEQGDESEQPARERTRDEKVLLIQLARYRTSAVGRKYLQNVDLSPQRLEGMNEKQLRTLLEEAQLTVALLNGSAEQAKLFFGVSGVAEEMVSQYSPWDIRGTTRILQSSPSTADTVEEIMLQYTQYIRPEVRLGMCFLQAAYAAHSINTQKAQAVAAQANMEALKKPVGDEVVERFKAL